MIRMGSNRVLVPCASLVALVLCGMPATARAGLIPVFSAGGRGIASQTLLPVVPRDRSGPSRKLPLTTPPSFSSTGRALAFIISGTF
jgi:hypothetical protein